MLDTSPTAAARSPSLWVRLLSSVTDTKVSDHTETKAGEAREPREYDLLYFDANHDLDLTNDPVVKLRKDPPPALQRSTLGGDGGNAQVFDTLAVPLDYGPESGVKPFTLIPIQEKTYVHFLPAAYRQGTIRLGPRAFTATLAEKNDITGGSTALWSA